MTDPLPPRPSDHASPDFDALVRAHYGRLCNFAYRFVECRDVAEDIVQDVFTRLWRQRDRFDVRDPLPYLYQAVRNRAVSHQRRQGVRESWRRHVLAAAAQGSACAPSAAARVEATELAGILDRAVQALPERCRLIFVMHREQDLSYPQIAGALGISVKTVETQMGRALKALRTRLGEYLALAMAALPGARLIG